MCLVIELLDPRSTGSPTNLNVFCLSVCSSDSLKFIPRTALNCFICFEVYANMFHSLQVFFEILCDNT